MRAVRLTILLLIWGTAAGSAGGDEGEPSSAPAGRPVRPEAVIEMEKQLREDEKLQMAVAERILKSEKVTFALTKELNEDKKRAEVLAWVKIEPTTAAELAIGLTEDDVNGNHRFEDTVGKNLNITLRRNNTGRGAYGVLKGAAKTSKLMALPANDKTGEEERRELLRSMFEGTGGASGQVIRGQAPEGKAAGAEAAPNAALASSFYDRLTAGNLRGYSPQLMALQSALNTRRPPGTPALIETGKLDHATLSYPAYGLRYDLGNVEDRLRRARIAELATLGGFRLTESDMKDPQLEARLLSKVPLERLPKRFAARAAANAQASAALEAFEAAAARSSDPARITKELLLELSARQREASRWLTAAALEEELARIESEESFLTPDLLAAIDAVPAPPAVRESYKRRGRARQERVLTLKANVEAALYALRTPSWQARIAEIEKKMAENQLLRRSLSSDISDYRVVPYKVLESVLRQPRWRDYLDDFLAKFAGSTSYGQAVRTRRANLARSLASFHQIASE